MCSLHVCSLHVCCCYHVFSHIDPKLLSRVLYSLPLLLLVRLIASKECKESVTTEQGVGRARGKSGEIHNKQRKVECERDKR